jgi:hypothetical protein
MAHPDGSPHRPATRIREIPDDLYDYARPPHRRVGRPVKIDPATWTVTDDWPARVSVTEAEVALFEASSDPAHNPAGGVR